MGDTAKKLVFVGVGVAALVVLAYFAYDAYLDDTEDRPPIVVNESSVDIENVTRSGVAARPWRRDPAAEKWKMDHPRGRNATGFSVSGTGCTASGAEVVIEYGSGGSLHKFRFYLDPHPGGKKMEPAIDSTVPMASDNSASNKKTIRYAGAGDIVAVTVGGTTACTFQASQTVRLDVTVN